MFEQLPDKLLMSDSLQGMIPELEDQIKDYEDSIIVIGVEYAIENFKDVLAGSLVGISFEPDTLKIDFRKKTNESYKFFNLCLKNAQIISNAVYLQNGEDESIIEGPFKIASPKLTDLDHKEKTCTISLDLVRIVK